MSKSKSAEFSISENRVESPSYEIRKLINGQIDSVLYSPATDRVLVMAGGYLWKIHPGGYVEDTLLGTSNLRDTGIKLWTGGYRRGEQHFTFMKWNDWLFSGDKFEHDLASLPLDVFEVKGIDESPDRLKQLNERLAKAELVEFYQTRQDASEPLKLALIKEKGQWTHLDLSQTALEMDDSCTTYKHRAWDIYDRSCLQGFTRSPQEVLMPLSNEISFNADLADETLPLRLKRFKRKFYTYEEGFGGWLLGKTVGKYLKSRGIPGSLPESYWVGMADMTLDFREESFSFKGLVTRKESRYEMDNFYLYALPTQSDDDAGYIEITYKGAEHNRYDRIERFVEYHEQDVGFYAIRSKQHIRDGMESNTAMQPANAVQAKAGEPWQIEFSGPWKAGKFDNYLWGNITFRDDLRPAHFLLDPIFVPESFHHLPESVEWVWEGHGNYPAYALEHGDEPALMLNLAATPPNLRLDLDHQEMHDAFIRISNQGPSDSVISLRIQLKTQLEAQGRLQLFLVKGNREIELHRAKLSNLTDLEQVTFFEPNERTHIESRFNKGKLKILFEEARLNPDSFSAYVSLAKQMLQENSDTHNFAPIITKHAVEHFLELIEKGETAQATDVFYHYVHQLLPHIRAQQKTESVAYNITVFASQGLVLSIMNKDDALEKAIFEDVLAPDLDLSTQTNPTFLYNLACYYSLHEKKPKLIAAMKRALELGKPAQQFRQDSDFDQYREDSDFEHLLQQTE